MQSKINLHRLSKIKLGLSYCRMIQTKSTLIGNQKINYVETGIGKINVFCMPGVFGSAWLHFQPQIEKLNKDLFRIIAWDPPGFGLSRPDDRKFTNNFYRDDADMAVKFLTKINIKKTSIMGWSDGGITGLILASKYPSLVENLIVWGSNSYILKEEVTEYQKLRNLEYWSPREKNPLLELYGEKYFKQNINDWCDVMQEIYKNGGNICKEDVEFIECPTLILHGSKDPMVLPEHPKYLKKNIKNSRLIEFPEGKHNIHLRYADEFNEIVTEFLYSKSSKL